MNMILIFSTNSMSGLRNHGFWNRTHLLWCVTVMRMESESVDPFKKIYLYRYTIHSASTVSIAITKIQHSRTIHIHMKAGERRWTSPQRCQNITFRQANYLTSHILINESKSSALFCGSSLPDKTSYSWAFYHVTKVLGSGKQDKEVICINQYATTDIHLYKHVLIMHIKTNCLQ